MKPEAAFHFHLSAFRFWRAHGPTLPAAMPPVPSALRRFTTRFGMDRGGSVALRARHWLRAVHLGVAAAPPAALRRVGSAREALAHAPASPLPVTGPPARVACPVLCGGAYLSITARVLILGGISHLDAFSGSCRRT